MWFVAEGSPTQILAVELKHKADYHEGQPGKYFGDLPRSKSVRSALVVLTGRRHRQVDEKIKKNPRWLGEVRWAAVSDELDTIEFEPDHALLGEAWRAVVKKMRADGDLGIDAKQLSGFARWAAGKSRSMVEARAVLESVASEAETALATQLEPLGFRSKLDRPSADNEVVDRQYDRLGLRFDIWRAKRGRYYLDLRLLGASMRVEFGPVSTNATLSDLKEGMRAGGFRSSDWNWHRDFHIDPADVVTGADLARFILKNWKLAVRGLKALEPFRTAAATH